MDLIEMQLRSYYEAEAEQRLRRGHEGRRSDVCEAFARRLASEGRRSVIDVGAGPAADHGPFAEAGVHYVGVDLAVGNAVIAAEIGRVVVPASLFDLPFAPASFSAGWSMSTFQHVPDARLDDALVEFARVLEPGAPFVIGLWGGRDEVIDATSSWTGIDLPRQFTLRTHDRTTEMLQQHLVVDSTETFPAGPSDWEYHIATGRTPSVGSAYDAIAPLYAEQFLDEIDRDENGTAWLRTFAERAARRSGPVLDLGCGPGGVVNRLCQLGVAATGIDSSPGQIAEARLAFPNLRFVVGDFTTLEADDGTVGGIVSRYSIIHLEPARLRDVFGEWLRALEPGAPLLLSFFGSMSPQTHGNPFDHKVATAHELHSSAIAGDLRAAGFIDVEVDERPPGPGGRAFVQATALAHKPSLEQRRA